MLDWLFHKNDTIISSVPTEELPAHIRKKIRNYQDYPEVNFTEEIGLEIGSGKINFCPYCGAKVRTAGARFCVSCGKALVDE